MKLLLWVTVKTRTPRNIAIVLFYLIGNGGSGGGVAISFKIGAWRSM